MRSAILALICACGTQVGCPETACDIVTACGPIYRESYVQWRGPLCRDDSDELRRDSAEFCASWTATYACPPPGPLCVQACVSVPADAGR